LCIWLSNKSAATKLFLLCIARFFDEQAQSSSMSYAQVARDCGLHRNSARRIAKEVAGTWLHIHTNKGHYIEGKGHANRYDGTPPPELVEQLRTHLLEEAGAHEAPPTENYEGASGAPAAGRGRMRSPRNAITRAPESQPRAHEEPYTYSLSNKEKGKADAPPPSQNEDLAKVPPPSKKGASARKKDAAPKGPHMNCSRFVIDATKELFIEAEVLERWRRDFPHIPDLVAKLQALSVHFINGNQWVKFREFPHLYFTDKLAADNKRLAPKVGGARKSKAKPGELNLDKV
jgi:hypothetical protein